MNLCRTTSAELRRLTVPVPVPAPDETLLVRVLIEHPVMRAGWESILAAMSDIDVISDEGPQRDDWDLTFIDLNDFAGRDALTAAPAEPLVVAMTEEQLTDILPHALGGVVRAMISPEDPVDDIRAALSASAQGHLWVSASLRESLSAPLEEQVAPTDELTGRELEMARMLLTGATNAEIAEVYGISVSTVKYHVSNLMRKLGIARRSQIARALNRF
ncbi:response regulator transcription factor [Saccharothrix algeriensis]|uniref:Response regulator transcription factor n=1 Tax=Saccharothrix algeriensis TaxID=173560 RepID=A0A8T8I1J6_9PSEU|nr:response regulator transcription factor [Saccharothrix algeriensis]